MLRSLVLTAAAAIVAMTAVASTADAAGSRHRFAIFDANSGKKVFDDGKLDGRACAVGKRAIFNPATGRFTTVPAAKCNF